MACGGPDRNPGGRAAPWVGRPAGDAGTVNRSPDPVVAWARWGGADGRAYPWRVVSLSGSQWVFVLIFDVALAFLGFRLAEADKRSLGRTPWGVASLGWAAIWFVSPLLGFVLWFVAHRAEVRRAGRGPLGPMGPMGPVGRGVGMPMPDQSRSVGSDFPAYPRPADGSTYTPVTGTPQPPPVPLAPPMPPPPPVREVPPPGWHPDPGGRFHYRWWTGSEWTSHVATHGQVHVDTNPDQRIGPY